MMFESVIEVYVNRKTDDCFVSKFVKTKVGSLEGWFAHGRLYKFKKNDLMELGWDKFYEILCDEQKDYDHEKSELDMMKASVFKNYKLIGLSLIKNMLSISPHNKMDRHRGSESMYSTEMSLPINNDKFVEKLRQAISDAE